MKRYLVAIFVLCAIVAHGQEALDVDDLKKEILQLKEDVQVIQLNLVKGEARFKRGLVVATVGYCVTIAGGLMLGRKNDDLGKVLLVFGGATGITGTVMMMDAFKYLGRAGKSARK